MHFLFEKLLPFFLPSQCACCGRFLEEGQEGICSCCLSNIRRIRPPYCSICGTPFISETAGEHPCGPCVLRRRYFTMARAVGYYEGPLQEAIHRWKYEGKIHLTPFFGKWMAEELFNYWDADVPDLLVPVPLHVQRLRERGFNQALLLVRELGRHTGIPYPKRILRKKRATVPQVQLSGSERERGVRGTFEVFENGRVEKKSILLVDDVFTTGATVNECARVLVAAGAQRVDVFTLAHAVRNS